MRRITTMLLISAPIAALLAGCNPGAGTSTAAPGPTSSTTTVAGDSNDGGTGADAAGTGATATSGGGSSQAGGGTTRCHAAGLKVSVAADPGGGAAGSNFELLVFTNTSGHTCTLTGYPGVSYVAGNQGTQVNVPFTRDSGQLRSAVRLLPGAKAHATVRIPNWQNFPADKCKPVSIRGFRVYPPDETASIFVSQPQQACSVKGAGVGVVRPITLTD